MNNLDTFVEQMKLKWKIKPIVGSRDYWRYRADQNKYIQLKNQIKKIDGGQELLVDDLLHEQVENIFK